LAKSDSSLTANEKWFGELLQEVYHYYGHAESPMENEDLAHPDAGGAGLQDDEIEKSLFLSLGAPVARVAAAQDLTNDLLSGVVLAKGQYHYFSFDPHALQAVTSLADSQLAGGLLFGSLTEINKAKRGARKPGHKYVHRHWKNGRWQYTYSESKSRKSGIAGMVDAAMSKTRHSLELGDPPSEPQTAADAFHSTAKTQQEWVPIPHPLSGDRWVEVKHLPHVTTKPWVVRQHKERRVKGGRGDEKRYRGGDFARMMQDASVEGGTHEDPFQLHNDPTTGDPWLSVVKLPAGQMYKYRVKDLGTGLNWNRGSGSQGRFKTLRELNARVRVEKRRKRVAAVKGDQYPHKGRGNIVVDKEAKPRTAILESGELAYTAQTITLWGSARSGILIPNIDDAFITGLMTENVRIIRSQIRSALRRFNMGISQVSQDRMQDIMATVGAAIVGSLRRYDPSVAGFESFLKVTLREQLASKDTKSPLSGEVRRVADDFFRNKGRVEATGEDGSGQDVMERVSASATPLARVRLEGHEAVQALASWKTKQEQELLSWVGRNPEQAQSVVEGGKMLYEQAMSEIESVSSLGQARQYADKFTGKFGVQPITHTHVQVDLGQGRPAHLMRPDEIVARKQRSAIATRLIDSYSGRASKLQKEAVSRFFQAHTSGDSLDGIVGEIAREMIKKYNRRRRDKVDLQTMENLVQEWITTIGKDIVHSRE
jgi:hypothetical protein